MTMGEFRRQTADLPDNAPLLLGFQDDTQAQFVKDAAFVAKTENWPELQKKYGWEMFGAATAPAAILSTFDTDVPKPRKRPARKAKAEAGASA